MINSKLMQLVNNQSSTVALKEAQKTGKLLYYTDIVHELIIRFRDKDKVNDLLQKAFQYLVSHTDYYEYTSLSKIFDIGNDESNHIYLLQGTIELTAKDGKKTKIIAGSELANEEIARLKPRLFSAIAINKVILAKIDCELWDLTQKRSLECKNKQQASVQTNSKDGELNDSLSFGELVRAFFEGHQFIKVEQGQTIFQQGDEPDYYYMIKKGQCDVFQSNEELKTNTIINTLSSGQFFGEEALVKCQARNVGIVMKTDGQLIRIEQKQIQLLLSSLHSVDFFEAQTFIQNGYQPIKLYKANKDIVAEYEKANEFEQAKEISFYKLRNELSTMDKDAHYLIICENKEQCQFAAFIFIQEGFDNIVVLDN
ncbi:MAG: cyclic nucleotide-binding domain-containing protein [Gammaproteobacteria bacterium]|nr:cyclic nucleotide-binding domain-containing protein [Gammaproteobacteria bacterium]